MQEKRFDVVALGELLIDFTNNGMSSQGNMLFEANPGGAPCNVLSMLQNLGKKTAFVGKVGNDMFGEMLIDVVKKQGICTDYLGMDESVPTTLAFVHTKEDGDRSFSFYRNPGADMMVRDDDYDEKLFENTRIFHFGTLSMTEGKVANTTKKAVDMAKSKGNIISFDPNYRPLLWDDSEMAKQAMWYGIGECDILKIADDEISFLTGQEDIDEGIKLIMEKSSARIICATLGKEGSKVFYEGKSVFCPAVIQPDTIETTGAGDTFMACILNYVLDNGMDDLSAEQLNQMIKFANAAASIITTRKGALKVMPEKAEIEAIND